MDDRAHGVDLMTRRARPGPPGTRRDEANSVLDTTEIRWFVPGPLPADIAGWFRGSTGVSEERYDTYLLGGRRDTGVKRRFRQTLEVKVRQSLEERVELGDGLTGPLEVWRKWSPADDPDDDGAVTIPRGGAADGDVARVTVPASMSRWRRRRRCLVDAVVAPGDREMATRAECRDRASSRAQGPEQVISSITTRRVEPTDTSSTVSSSQGSTRT